MSQAMRKLAGNLNRTKTVCLFTNQIREKIGVQFGSPETQPGGRALKFYASQRLDIRRIETLKEGTEAVGNRVRVKVVKNKVAAPVPPGRVRHRVRGRASRARAACSTSAWSRTWCRSPAPSSPTGRPGSARGATTPSSSWSTTRSWPLEIETKVRTALGIDGEAPQPGETPVPAAAGRGESGLSRRLRPPASWLRRCIGFRRLMSNETLFYICGIASGRLGGRRQLHRAASSRTFPGEPCRSWSSGSRSWSAARRPSRCFTPRKRRRHKAARARARRTRRSKHEARAKRPVERRKAGKPRRTGEDAPEGVAAAGRGPDGTAASWPPTRRDRLRQDRARPASQAR